MKRQLVGVVRALCAQHGVAVTLARTSRGHFRAILQHRGMARLVFFSDSGDPRAAHNVVASFRRAIRQMSDHAAALDAARVASRMRSEMIEASDTVAHLVREDELRRASQ